MLNSGKALLCTQLPVRDALPLTPRRPVVFFRTQSSYLTPGLGPGHAINFVKLRRFSFKEVTTSVCTIFPRTAEGQSFSAPLSAGGDAERTLP